MLCKSSSNGWCLSAQSQSKRKSLLHLPTRTTGRGTWMASYPKKLLDRKNEHLEEKSSTCRNTFLICAETDSILYRVTRSECLKGLLVECDLKLSMLVIKNEEVTQKWFKISKYLVFSFVETLQSRRSVGRKNIFSNLQLAAGHSARSIRKNLQCKKGYFVFLLPWKVILS